MYTSLKAALIAFTGAGLFANGLQAQEVPATSGAKMTQEPTEHPDKADGAAMTRVTGIGGVFIKAKEPAKLRAWYKAHLGIDVQAWGGASFRWVDGAGVPTNGTTAWMVGNGSNFAPSNAPFMRGYRVKDLHQLLKLLREEGCQVLDSIDQSEFGIFGWVMDPEGNKIELWQPPEGK